MSDSDQPTALLVSRDLFFTSKVSGTAAALGIQLQIVPDSSSVARIVQDTMCRCVFVDLADPSLDVANVLGQLAVSRLVPVVAFGSHVQTARLEEARVAGCTEVMPRSRFSAALPEILTQYCLASRDKTST